MLKGTRRWLLACGQSACAALGEERAVFGVLILERGVTRGLFRHLGAHLTLVP